MGLGCRGNWAVAKNPCNHSEERRDSSDLP